MRPPSPSLPERDFTLEALRQNVRVDGRSLLDMREVELEFGGELGWVECSLGKTRVLAYVDAKMVKPLPERPLEGMITIHSEISPMASSEYELGRASEEEVTITRMLDKVLRRSDAVDRESLCILGGQRVWHLRLTLHFLADAGNMLDCACLAGITALRHFRKPDVEVIGEEVIVHDPSERAPVPLSMHHTPYCLTFAYFPPFASPTSTSSDPDTASTTPPASAPTILDPASLESALSSGTLSIALTPTRELVVLQKNGGVALDSEDVLRIVRIAGDKVKLLEERVKRALDLDWAKRKGGVEGR